MGGGSNTEPGWGGIGGNAGPGSARLTSLPGKWFLTIYDVRLCLLLSRRGCVSRVGSCALVAHFAASSTALACLLGSEIFSASSKKRTAAFRRFCWVSLIFPSPSISAPKKRNASQKVSALDPRTKSEQAARYDARRAPGLCHLPCPDRGGHDSSGDVANADR
jgi:hypothetical protein